MAYQSKYYKEIVSQGHTWRVEIWQDAEADEIRRPMEIGPILQGLRLILQGDQADIDTPIVKTSLEMVFVDAPDLDRNLKCGEWEEFYTSSATEYKVLLYKDNAIEWTGYITPDSFSENLQYRGSVTIIARDNLGALQDFFFDTATMSNDFGMVSAYDLINKSFLAASIGMDLQVANRGLFCVIGENIQPGSAISSEFNAISFKDKTLWECLESALYSLGLCLRYKGKNSFVISTIRDVGLLGEQYWWDVNTREAKFLAVAHRELAPAIKSIKDEVKFDISENLISAEITEDKYGDAGKIEFEPYNTSVAPPANYDIPIHAYSKSNGWQATPASRSILLNPYAYRVKTGYAGGGALQGSDALFIAVNDKNIDATALYSQYLSAGEYEFKMHMADLVALYDNNTRIGIMDVSKRFLSYFLFRAKYYSYSGIVYHYSGEEWVEGDSNEWISNSRTDDEGYLYPYDLPFDFIIPINNFGFGKFELEIGGIRATWIPQDGSDSRKSRGAYALITEVSLVDKTLQEGEIAGSLKILTNYNSSNNIALTRQLAYAPNPSNYDLPRAVLNGIFSLNPSEIKYIGSAEWYWDNPIDSYPLSVQLHRQILAYYAKPNNVLEGELYVELDMPDFHSLWRWNGKNHILISGALNILTGRMENAILREFMRFDHMWETWINEDDEDIVIDYPETISLVLRAQSNRVLSRDDVTNLPLWLSLRAIHSQGQGEYNIILRAMANESGQERSAIFKVDTAYVRVTQRAAGDYGIDYGKDYS